MFGFGQTQWVQDPEILRDWRTVARNARREARSGNPAIRVPAKKALRMAQNAIARACRGETVRSPRG